MNMKIYINHEIYWGLLGLLFIRIIMMNEQIFFIVTILYFLHFILKYRKLRVPKIQGLKLYAIFIFYSTIVGLILYPVRNVIRDLFYIVPTVLWILIGYNLSSKNNTGKSIKKTLYAYGALISVKCVIEFLIKRTFDFNQIRIVFGTYIYDIGFLLSILAFEIFILKKEVFSKKVDRCIFFVMLVQIGLSFGRIAILEPMLSFSIIGFLSIVGLNYKGRTLKTITRMVIILTIAVIALFYVLPDSTTLTFLTKINNSLSEINTKQDIDSVTMAMQNWRAYEMQAAWTQWKSSSIFSQIFGHGMGKGIALNFVPYNWLNAGMVVNGEMPLAHNGFYTLLPKGGLFAVISILWIFIGAMYKGMYMVRRGSKESKVRGIILVSTMVAGFANMWVVRGAVCSDAFVVWGLILGWIYAEERNKVIIK